MSCFCTKCGVAVTADANFCESCGAPVESAPSSAPPSGGVYDARASAPLSSRQTPRVALFAVLSIALLAALAGGGWYWLVESKRPTPERLRAAYAAVLPQREQSKDFHGYCIGIGGFFGSYPARFASEETLIWKWHMHPTRVSATQVIEGEKIFIPRANVALGEALVARGLATPEGGEIRWNQDGFVAVGPNFLLTPAGQKVYLDGRLFCFATKAAAEAVTDVIGPIDVDGKRVVAARVKLKFLNMEPWFQNKEIQRIARPATEPWEMFVLSSDGWELIDDQSLWKAADTALAAAHRAAAAKFAESAQTPTASKSTEGSAGRAFGGVGSLFSENPEHGSSSKELSGDKAQVLGAPADAPSTDTILQAVGAAVAEGNIPHKFRGLTDSKNPRVDALKVLQVGKFQQNPFQSYWPVRIYIAGSVDKGINMLPSTKYVRRNFEGEVEYAVSQDPYGKWTASELDR